MGEKITVGPITKGLRNDRTAFNIDNDSFPTLINAYQWRGRAKRKRGTSTLGRLTRFFNSLSLSYTTISSVLLVNSGPNGTGNLITGFLLDSLASFVPGSVNITDTTSSFTYSDTGGTGILYIGLSPTGSINYATGAFVLNGAAGHSYSANFLYYPGLPVLGEEDVLITSTQFPGTLAFDTTYSYNISNSSPYPINDVTFYKNLPTGTYTNYVQKTNPTGFNWNGNTYQQFWSMNYEGAFWVTNGIPIPFSSTNIGMQFKTITAITYTNGGASVPSTATITIPTHGLVIGDFIFLNEILGITGINFQTGYVTTVVNVNQVIVTFTLNNNLPSTFFSGAYTSGGIAQYLTSNAANPTLDCIRWYDGDPTNGSATSPSFLPGEGWVNFAPPLSQSFYSISGLPAAQYYLVGARMMVPFKDRFVCLGPVVQSSNGVSIYLQDVVLYSENGSPYYTASYINTPTNTIDTPTSVTNIFNSILVPTNQTAFPPAWFEDQTGFGGFIPAGISQPMTTVNSNEDVLIIGMSTLKLRMIYTGDDITPFNLYVINAELGDSSTFSTINMDKGVISRGSRGFIITGQTEASRIDLEIPDEVFEINLLNNGNESFCATRDFINEWIYFTYANPESYKYPNQSLLYNYRDNSWAVFYESYTTYGSFKRQTGFTWATVGNTYPTWSAWNEPWNAGDSTLLQQEVLAGNQQGFVIVKDEGTGEGTSLYIQNIAGNNPVVVTSPDHNLNESDYIIITGIIGSFATPFNGLIFQAINVTQNTFNLLPDPTLVVGTTYIGGGLITRMYVPFIQTKQFPTAWGIGRKTRLGPQMYLLTTTAQSQITLNIYLSQDGNNAYNAGSIVPEVIPPPFNNSLIYSTILYTCPESTNLGLTPANVNLQMPTAAAQSQIWHRVNTSLIGDTVQIGFTMSDAQMRDLEVTSIQYSITAASQAYPCVLNTLANFEIGTMVLINGVVGMTQLNGNYYQVISSTSTQVTIGVDSTAFTAYSSGGTIESVANLNGFAEIELHGFILDVNPSQMLA